jgi:hypothetical protein
MSNPASSSPLLQYLHIEFRQAFGQPSSMLEMDSQWSLRSQPEAPAIFILVNGSYEKPAVWIFDPYEADNVWRTSITSTTEVDDAISIIKARLTSAATAWANGWNNGSSNGKA